MQVVTSRKNNDFSKCYNNIKSGWNEDKSNYYYNIILEKASYELSKK